MRLRTGATSVTMSVMITAAVHNNRREASQAMAATEANVPSQTPRFRLTMSAST